MPPPVCLCPEDLACYTASLGAHGSPCLFHGSLGPLSCSHRLLNLPLSLTFLYSGNPISVFPLGSGPFALYKGLESHGALKRLLGVSWDIWADPSFWGPYCPFGVIRANKCLQGEGELQMDSLCLGPSTAGQETAIGVLRSQQRGRRRLLATPHCLMGPCGDYFPPLCPGETEACEDLPSTSLAENLHWF